MISAQCSRVLTCLTVQHDWHLVALAVAVCFLASGVTICLFQRAQAATGQQRFFLAELGRRRGWLWHLGYALHRDARL